MGGQPGGPIPIDSPVGPVFAEDHGRPAHWRLRWRQGGWANGIWTALVMPVNACRLQIIRPTAIMKNGWPGWRPCWWKQGWFQQTKIRKGQALPGAAGLRLQPPQLNRWRRSCPWRAVSCPDRAPPRFALGQRVTVLDPDQITLSPNGYTRLPAYSAGCTGQIIRHHHSHVLPDSNAHGLGEAPEHLYGVCFACMLISGRRLAIPQMRSVLICGNLILFRQTGHDRD